MKAPPGVILGIINSPISQAFMVILYEECSSLSLYGLNTFVSPLTLCLNICVSRKLILPSKHTDITRHRYFKCQALAHFP